jgi:thiol:disulfide interchange protein DsbD
MFLIVTVLATAAVCAEDLAARLGAGSGEVADPLAAVTAALGDPVAVSAVVEPGSGGRPDQLAVTATLEEGWHLYAISQKRGGPIATKITLAADSPRKITGAFVPDAEPHRRTVEDVPAWKGLVIEEHSGRVVWRAPLESGAGDIRGAVSLQLCQDTTCLPPQTIPFTVSATAAPAAIAVAPSPAAALQGPPPALQAPPPAIQRSPPAAAAFVEHVPDRTHAMLRAGFRPGGDPASSSLVIEIVPEEGWHVYRPAGSAESKIGQGKPTIVASGSGANASLARVTVAKATPTTHAELVEAGAVDGPVVLDVLVKRSEEGGAEATLEALVGLQTCSDQTCDPPTAVRLQLTVPTEAEPSAEAARSWQDSADASASTGSPRSWDSRCERP